VGILNPPKGTIMQFNHVVVWLDHHEAHLIGFNREASEASVVHSGLDTRHVHAKDGHDAPATARYFDTVLASLKHAAEVLVVGPGLEKLRLIKHVLHHHPQEADRFIGIETVDHPSDAQLLAFARKYFRRADQMR
jgi:hypothetical protein